MYVVIVRKMLAFILFILYTCSPVFPDFMMLIVTVNKVLRIYI
jgi:hypothetical protein